jgi:hypothetical protein
MTITGDQSAPPWTQDEVASLNAYQACGYAHPFTNGDGAEQVDLIATPDGWVRETAGPIVQYWAHTFMADWSWRNVDLENMYASVKNTDGQRSKSPDRRCAGCGEFDEPGRDPLCYAQHDSRSGHVDVDVDEKGIVIVAKDDTEKG